MLVVVVALGLKLSVPVQIFIEIIRIFWKLCKSDLLHAGEFQGKRDSNTLYL